MLCWYRCGAYLILAAGVTNYREKTIREEQLIAGETTRKELESIKRVIENKNELKEIEDIVKQSKKPDTLYTELTHRISNPVNTKVISAKGTTIAKGDEDIGKIVEQLGGNSSTRII